MITMPSFTILIGPEGSFPNLTWHNLHLKLRSSSKHSVPFDYHILCSHGYIAHSIDPLWPIVKSVKHACSQCVLYMLSRQGEGGRGNCVFGWSMVGVETGRSIQHWEQYAAATGGDRLFSAYFLTLIGKVLSLLVLG